MLQDIERGLPVKTEDQESVTNSNTPSSLCLLLDLDESSQPAV